jgi:hypothetical protein
MADQSQFSILTFQRQPGRWRASISRNDRSPIGISGTTMLSFVTPEDSNSEDDAVKAAKLAVREI